MPALPERWWRTPGHHPSFNSALGTLHCAGVSGCTVSFPCHFLAAATCPGREWSLGHGEHGGPQGCPKPANSHERSAQNQPSLCRTLVRIGRKTPGDVSLGAARLQGCPRAWPDIVSARTRTPPIGTPQDGLPRGQHLRILGLWGSHPCRYNMGLGPSQSPAGTIASFPAFCFWSPVLHGSISGNVSPAATQAPTANSGASDNPQNEIKLCAQN